MDVYTILKTKPIKNNKIEFDIYDINNIQILKKIAKKEDTTITNIMNNLIRELVDEYQTYELTQTDMSAYQNKPNRILINTFHDIIQSLKPDAKEELILSEMIKTKKWDKVTAKEFLQHCHRTGLIFETSPGNYILV